LDLDAYDTDKIRLGYLELYDPILTPWTDKEIKLLEIGVRAGGSLKLWRDYFPRGTIIGIDRKLPQRFEPGARIQIFQGDQADKAFLSKVNGGRAISDYRKDQVVYTQGQPADSVFYIQSGKVKKTVVSEQGKEAVVALLGADDFVGEGCLAGQPLRLSTASAMMQCVIVRIAKADITRVIHEEPAFAELFISHLLARNSRVEEDLVDQLFNSSEKRLARTLLLLANFGKEGRPEPVIAKISQETLAEMIGTTRSRVSFFMNKFRELGLIDYNGHIEVHSSLLNVVLHDQPQIRR
jgi:CRP-like cAMP-binding protein